MFYKQFLIPNAHSALIYYTQFGNEDIYKIKI